MISWPDVLTRADSSKLSIILGEGLVPLLTKLDPDLARVGSLRRLVIDAVQVQDVLTDSTKWKVLVSLLRSEEAAELVHGLGAADESNDFNRLEKIVVKRNSAALLSAMECFGLTLPDPLSATVTAGVSDVTVAYPAYQYQRSIISRARRVLSAKSARLMVHMPTGSGKTRTAIHLICAHLVSHEPGVVIWLANSEELCDQAAEEFENAWKHLGNRQIPVYRFWGHVNEDLADVEEGFVVMGVQKAQALMARGDFSMLHLADKTSLVVFDEAHQAIAPKYREVLDALLLRPERPGLLGLSATPGRSWANQYLDEELSDFFQRNKVSIDVDGYDNPVTFLVDNGYLAKADFQPLKFDSSALTVPKHAKADPFVDYSNQMLQGLGASEMRNFQILQRLNELAKEHQRIIYFAPSVENAELIALALHASGTRASSVTSKTEPALRQAAISEFKGRSLETQVLCNYGVLTTGFDAPRTSAVLIARPTKSLVLYSQMVGRAIRGPKSGGNESATIVTVVDSTLPGFGDVGEAFNNWEDVW